MSDTADSRYAVSEAIASQAEYPVNNNAVPYAGFWRRAGGYLIDYLIIRVVVYLSDKVVFPAGRPAVAAAVIYSLVETIAVCLYFAVLESSEAQSTFGKRAVGIKVTDLNGEQISFWRAMGRVWARVLSLLILGIGFVMAAFTERRQTLHDKIAGTLVVRREEPPRDIEQAGAAPRVSGWLASAMVIGWLLLEAGVAGVAGYFLYPTYREALVREQARQGLAAAGPFEAEVEEAVARGDALESLDNQALDMKETQTFSPYVASIRVWHGGLEINFGPRADAYLKGGHLVLVPALTSDSRLVWICGHANPPPGVKPAINNYRLYTNIHERWLPEACSARYTGSLKPEPPADP